MKVIFDPNCEFPDDMTQEELDELVKQIKQMAEDGTLLENSEIVDLDELEEEDPELFERINKDQPTIN